MASRENRHVAIGQHLATLQHVITRKTTRALAWYELCILYSRLKISPRVVQLLLLENSLFSLYSKMAVIGSIFWMVCLAQLDTRRAYEQDNLIENSSIDTAWRHTEFGWQNSNLWQHRAIEAPIISHIHPFIFTAAILLAVLGLMIWSSNEVELDSLSDSD